MTISARAAASRRNGSCSRGPVTAAGRARSAVNSRKHGLCSREFRLDGAVERREFEALLADIEFTCRPVGAAQHALCRHLAVALWRLRVCDNLEAALLRAIERGEACAEAGGDGLPGLRTLTRYRARLSRDMREARQNLDDLRARRVQAMGKRIEIAREFRQQTHLNALKAELGEEGFARLREDVTNEPEPPAGEGNRAERRRRRAVGRKRRKG